MSTTQRAGLRTTGALLTVFAAAVIGLGAAAQPALAAGAAGEVVAIDSSTVIAASTPTSVAVSGPRAAASAPGEITVTGHGGKPVTLTAKGMAPKRVPRPGKAPATFTGLTPGKAYQVRVGTKAIGTVVALTRPGAASNLSVRTTGLPSTVALAWAHQQTVATGGRATEYVVTATSATAPTVSAKVTSAKAAELPGLEPTALYTFTVTPMNSAGAGKATRAIMTRSLASITGGSPTAPATPVAEKQVATQAAPAAAQAPAAAPAAPSAPSAPPAPSGPPAPATRTVSVCPDGFSEVSGTCTKTTPYTFTAHTETQPYTYHSVFVETSRTWRTYPIADTGCIYGGTLHNGECVGWDIQGYTTTQRDALPAGWMDDGTQWVRTTQVKDATPTGWTDDGAQWVQTTDHVTRVVPA